MTSQTLAPAEPAWNWLEEVRTAAFDDLMPMTSAASLLAAYRTHRDLYHDVHERHFRIGVADGQSVAGDRLTAVVVVPANQSIQQQLLVSCSSIHFCIELSSICPQQELTQQYRTSRIHWCGGPRKRRTHFWRVPLANRR